MLKKDMTRAELAKELVRTLCARGLTVATAESCTGGLIAKLITDVPGSSSAFFGGLVTYTNEIKTGVLGVEPAIIETHTEVSIPCAEAMAIRARTLLGTTYGVSATGYAGPGGGSACDPVGTVYLAVATPKGVRSERFSAPVGSNRRSVRNAAAKRALELLLLALNE